jgi:GNAT superfamily N-acetyltransferase
MRTLIGRCGSSVIAADDTFHRMEVGEETGPLIAVREQRPDDLAWAAERDAEAWGGPLIARRGELLDLREYPAVVAELAGERAGLARYAIRGDACELLSLESTSAGHGIGRALMDAVLAKAIDAGCRRLWVVTTNDNTRAIRVYQQWGFNLAALHRNAITDERRTLKPQIPELGMDGIPLRHEIELERWLNQ